MRLTHTGRFVRCVPRDVRCVPRDVRCVPGDVRCVPRDVRCLYVCREITDTDTQGVVCERPLVREI